MADSTLEIHIQAFVDGLDSLKQLGTNLADALAQATGLGQGSQSASEGITALGEKAESSSASLGDLAKILEGIQENTSTTNEKLEDLGKKTEEAGEKAHEAGGVFGELKEHFLEIIETLGLLEIAYKAVEFGSESLKSVEAIQDSLARVQITAKGTAEEFGEMSEAVEQASEKVNVEGSAAAAGLQALANAGFDAKGAVEALIPTLELAKVAQIDVGTAAEAVHQSIAVFGASAGDAAHVVDVLYEASRGVAGGLGTLSFTLTQVGLSAKEVGLSFEETAGLVSELGKSGINTQRVGMALRQVFADLEKEGSPLRLQLLGLGDNSSSFTKALQALSTGGDQAKTIISSFGVATQQVLQALVDKGPQAYSVTTTGLNDVDGAANKASQTLDDTLSGSITAFKVSFDALGEALAAPILAPFSKAFTEFANNLKEFAKTDQFKEIVANVTQFANDAGKALTDFVTHIKWSDLVAGAQSFTKEIKDDFNAISGYASDLAKVFNKLGDTIGFVWNSGQAIIHTAAAGISSVVSTTSTALGVVDKTLAKVGLSTGETGEKLDEFGRVMADVANEDIDKAGKDIKGIADDLDDLTGVSTTASAAVEGVGNKTENAGNQHEKAAASVEHHTEAQKENTGVVGESSPVIDEHSKKTDTATQSQDALNKKLSDAKSVYKNYQDYVDAASKALADLIKNGQTSGPAFENASQDVQRAGTLLSQAKKNVDDAKGSFDGLLTAATQLGEKSPAQLQKLQNSALEAFKDIEAGSNDTVSSQNFLKASFEATAKQLLASIEYADPAERQRIETWIYAKAASLGLTDSIDDLVKKSNQDAAAALGDADARKKAADAAKDATTSNKNLGTSAGQAGRALAGASKNTSDYAGNLKLAADGSQSDSDRIKAANTAIQQATSDTSRQVAENAKSDINNWDSASNHLQSYTVNLGDISQQALAVLTVAQNAALQSIQGLTAGADIYVNAFNSVSVPLVNAIKDQTQGVQDLQKYYGNLGDAAILSQTKTAAGLEKQAAGLEAFSDRLKDGTSQFNYLGQQTLAVLESSVDATIGKVNALAAAIEQANGQLVDLGQQLQETLLQDSGDKVAIENDRYQQQLQQIKDLAAKGDASSQAQAQKDLQLAEQVHEEKLKAIADEAKQQADSNQSSYQQQSSNIKALEQQQLDAIEKTDPNNPANSGGGSVGGIYLGPQKNPVSSGVNASAVGGVGGVAPFASSSDVQQFLQSVAKAGGVTTASQTQTIVFQHQDTSVPVTVKSDDASKLIDLLKNASKSGAVVGSRI